MPTPNQAQTPSTAHTPGPWRIGDAGHTVFGPKTDQPAPVQIAVSLDPSPRCNASERKANLRLIAAAPELKAALEECELTFNALGSDLPPWAIKKWRRVSTLLARLNP